MKTNHTKGEWRVNTATDNVLYVYSTTSGAICSIPILSEHLKQEMNANAKLIAASPELLEDHITDIVCIQDFINRYKKGETNDVVYFLENLIISKNAVIKKATE